MGRCMRLRAHILTVPLLLLVMLAPPAGSEDAKPAGSENWNNEVMEAVLREDYFPLGTWRIGMKRDEALAHFSAVREDGNGVLHGITRTHFAAERPAEITFARNRLETVKLNVYEGTDFDQAVQRMQEALLFMNAHFAGANFEGGLKTDRDPKGELLRRTLAATIGSMESGTRSVDDEARAEGGASASASGGFTAFEMVLNFSTERLAPKNFLLGEFRYRSDTQVISVSIFDDRKFVKSRVPEASVMLFRSALERPAAPRFAVAVD
jgi:hypothetical protein